MKLTIGINLSLLLAISPLAAQTGKTKVQALLDQPLRDTAVCRGPDGAYYLTGTLPGPDGSFQNNEGIRLWRSTDLKEWKALGLLWNSDQRGQNRINPDDPTRPLVRGCTAPEIHYLKGNWYVTYSMNSQGTGLLKSTTGKVEGPYEDLGQITADGGDASILADDDGQVYWVFGEGWIARMNDDLSALAEEPRLLQPTPNDGKLPNSPQTVGRAAAFLFKAEGRYYLVAADVWGRLGNGCYDTFVAVADNVYGPYGQRRLMIPHGGQVTVFRDAEGRYLATFSGRDRKAALRDRPAIVPLEWVSEVMYGGRTERFLRKATAVVTERGPWDKLEPLYDVAIRDLQASPAPDGNYYLTGSVIGEDFAGRLGLLRSPDLRHWEDVKAICPLTVMPGLTAAEAQRRLAMERGLQRFFMDCEVYHLQGNFHVFGSLYGDKQDPKLTSGPMMLRSTTGRAEGPYEYVCRAKAQPSVFADDDGTTYLFANGNLHRMKPDLSGWEAEGLKLRTATGVALTKGDVATNLFKIHGKYVIFATSWNGAHIHDNLETRANDGTYDWFYFQSDTLEGPYHMPRRALPIPHAGHSCQPFKGPDGEWYGLFFGNDSTAPWWCKPGLLALRIDLVDGEIRVALRED